MALSAQPSVSAVQQGPRNSVGIQEQVGQDQQPAKPSPLTVPQNYALTASTAEGASRPGGEHESEWSLWIEALGTLATAFFTGVLWYSTSGLREETRRDHLLKIHLDRRRYRTRLSHCLLSTATVGITELNRHLSCIETGKLSVQAGDRRHVMSSTITFAINGKQYVMIFSGEGQSLTAPAAHGARSDAAADPNSRAI